MFKLKRAAICFFSCAVAFSFSACEKEALLDRDFMSANSKSIAQREDGGGYSPNPGGENLPHPTILKQTYIPKDPANAGTKTLAWKITWPTYPAGTDEDVIPTMFSTMNGALNSFNYLNSVDSVESFKVKFSLYYENRLIRPSDYYLWYKLDYLNMFNATTYGNVFILRITDSPATIEGWLKNNPGILESVWLSGNLESINDEEEYQAGDIFMFNELYNGQNKYGVIRIVSMYPRVIEVYLAVPNNVIEEAGS
jgi:hypothetical protein